MLKIRSVRGGSARMNEEERIQLTSLLIKAGKDIYPGDEQVYIRTKRGTELYIHKSGMKQRRIDRC